MGVISIENISRLYWLGRYSERVYTTIRAFHARYDRMIDTDLSDYDDYCRRQDIPNIYTSREDFLRRYSFDASDPNSIHANLLRAYDNAIVLREEIGSETLSYVQLAVYAMEAGEASSAPLVAMQRVIDNILAFWGIADDSIDDDKVRRIIKVGKRVERIDLYARLEIKDSEIRRELRRLNKRLEQNVMRHDFSKLAHLNYLATLHPVDYAGVISDIETLVDCQ